MKKKVIAALAVLALVLYVIFEIKTCSADVYAGQQFDTTLMKSVEDVNINHAEIKDYEADN